MANIYQARQKNAVRIAEKINQYIDAGYKIFDENGDLVTGRFVIEEDGSVNHALSDRCVVGYFINDMELDNGIYTTIKDYNAQFEEWTFLHPKHVKQLFRSTKCHKL